MTQFLSKNKNTHLSSHGKIAKQTDKIKNDQTTQNYESITSHDFPKEENMPILSKEKIGSQSDYMYEYYALGIVKAVNSFAFEQFQKHKKITEEDITKAVLPRCIKIFDGIKTEAISKTRLEDKKNWKMANEVSIEYIKLRDMQEVETRNEARHLAIQDAEAEKESAVRRAKLETAEFWRKELQARTEGYPMLKDEIRKETISEVREMLDKHIKLLESEQTIHYYEEKQKLIIHLKKLLGWFDKKFGSG